MEMLFMVGVVVILRWWRYDVGVVMVVVVVVGGVIVVKVVGIAVLRRWCWLVLWR